ncbi:MAG: PAS domain S-box protein, partial [Limisphaerales bacterium]
AGLAEFDKLPGQVIAATQRHGRQHLLWSVAIAALATLMLGIGWGFVLRLVRQWRAAMERGNEQLKLQTVQLEESNLNLDHQVVLRTVELTGKIAEIIQSEARLRGSEAQYRRLFEAAKDGILILNAETGVIEDVNPFLTELLGFTREQFLQKKVWELGFFKNLIANHEKFEELKRDEYVRYEDLPLEATDGRRIDVEFVSNVYEVNGARVIQCNVRNMTERKRNERELKQLHRRHELILNSVAEGIHGIDLQGNITFENLASEKMLGWENDDLVGRPAHALMHHSHADGSPYPVEECRIYATLRDGVSRHVNDEVFWRKDGTSFPVEYVTAPKRDESGAIRGAVVTFTDITEKKLLEAKFLRSQRMESLGSLAGGIAHDLNNALAPILMSAELLKQVIKDPNPGVGRIIDTIHSSAERGAGMVKQILTFARGSAGERGVVQPKHLIQEMIGLTRHSFPKTIQIRADVPSNIWTLLGNPTQLHQILLNLCVNARDAMPAGGTLTLAAGNVRLKATDTGLSPDAKPGPYMMLAVTDTGTGMTPEVRARLFEAFFTTKEPGKGTGLGLSTVRNIAKEHGGFLTVDSEAGKGTTFKVYLPAQPGAAAVVAAVARPALPTGSGELILVVDDEASIRSIATQTLEAYGYRVVTANDGAQAVGVCAQHLTSLQLLITDMDMPFMDGKKTIRAIRTLLPRLPVIASSGSDAESNPAVLKELDVQAFLRKPFSTDDLIRMVHETLREKGFNLSQTL